MPCCDSHMDSPHRFAKTVSIQHFLNLLLQQTYEFVT
jgi:hypothetical protein